MTWSAGPDPLGYVFSDAIDTFSLAKAKERCYGPMGQSMLLAARPNPATQPGFSGEHQQPALWNN
ncbi:MAG: hypothetical protein H6557_12375 [Lewinellaceae bacterium]|nr:hypothetical protein [Lewinellaceae bacterium]